MEVRQTAEHPTYGIAQLAICFDRGLENFTTDAQVIGIVRRTDPHAQDIGTRLTDNVLRRGHVAERFRHLATLLVEHETVRQHHIERRASTRAAGFEERRVEPAAMLIAAFEIHYCILAAIDLAFDAGECRKVLWVLQHEGMRGA